MHAPDHRIARSSPGRAVLVLAVLALAIATLLGAAGSSTAAALEDANVTAYRATDGSFDEAGEIEAAVGTGTLEPADRLVLGDRLVVAIDSPRLAETMSAGNGSPTDRFLAALRGEAGFRIVQTDHGTMVSPMFASIGPGNATVFRSGGTTYVVVDTGALAFRNPGSVDPPRIHGGERFAVEFGYDLPESRFRTDPRSPEIEIYRTASAFRLAATWNEPLPPEWVRREVTVNVPPERSVAVRLRLDTGRTIRTAIDPAGIPGQSTVWLDLRSVEPGTGYVLDLVYDGRVLERYEGTVREPHARLENATVHETPNGTAVAVTAVLSHGGAVQVLSESCRQVGWEWLDPGNETRLSIPLWGRDGERISAEPGDDFGVHVRAVRGRGTGRSVYGGPAAQTAIGVEGSCGAPELPWTPPATPTATPTASPPTTATGTPVDPSSRGDSPGNRRAAGTSSRSPAGVDTAGGTGAAGRTESPGQPGFAPLATLLALVASLAILARLATGREPRR